MFYLIPLACFFWVSAVLFLLLRKLGENWIHHLHFILFSAFFLLVHLFLPVLQQFIVFYRYSANYSLFAHSIVFAVSTAFWTLLTVGYYSRIRLQPFPKANIGEFDARRGPALLVLTIALAFGVAASAKILHGIYQVGFDRYFADRLSYQSFGGLVLVGHWTYAVCVASFYIFLTAKYSRSPTVKWLALTLCVASFVYSGTYYTLNGNRNSLFLLILNLIAIWLLVRRAKGHPLPIGRISIAAVALVIIFSALGFLRGNQYRIDSMAGFHDELAYSVTRSLNGAFGNNENCLWLIDNPRPLLMGSTYAAGFANFYPRAYWKNKPVGAGPIMRNYVHPGSYVVGGRNNTSYTTGLLNELQMNFGLIGALFLSPIIGLLYGSATVLTFRSNRSTIYLFGMVALTILGTLFVYGEFLGAFSRWIFSLFPLVALIFIRKRLVGIDGG